MGQLLPIIPVYIAWAIFLARRVVALLSAVIKLRNDWHERPR
jgi:hypothetical protein